MTDRRPWLALFSTVVVFVGLGGCTLLDGPAPSETDGKRLTGTGGVGQGGFSIARDGRWLSWASANSSPGAPRWILYRIETGETFSVRPDPGLTPRERYGMPWSRPGCWGRGEHRARVYWATASSLYFADARGGNPVLRAASDPSGARRTFYFECPGTVVEGVVRIEQPRASVVRIVADDPGGTVWASHTSWPFFTETVRVVHRSFSPDGRFFAYGIAEAWGSFVGGATGYLLDLRGSGGPRPLGRTMLGPIRWGPRGRVMYGRFEAQRGVGIYRWTLSDREKK